MPTDPDPVIHARLRELYEQLFDLDEPDRSAELDRLVPTDDPIRAPLIELLGGEGPSLLDRPVIELSFFGSASNQYGATPEPSQLPEVPGFSVLEKINEGGMGTVYRARQHTPRREVAIKLVKPGMDSHAVVTRFEAERQALALMDHPNIARVFGGGVTGAEHGSRPYFVMELVRGVPITEHCDAQRLTVHERCSLLARVCEAVQHAHAKGVIHRDLKPSNVLVEYREGESTPKVIDFGIAKALHSRLSQDSVLTRQGQLIGTLEYMSPEQAEMSPQGIDTRSDVYGLGVLLYELCSGFRPFEPECIRSSSVLEIQRLIREGQTPRPSARLCEAVRTASDSGAGHDVINTIAHARSTEPGVLARILRRDLDWVIMRCLEKDRERRYPTASELAEDLQRFLRSEPVVAGPPSALYRADKFVRRHSEGVIIATLTGAVLVGASIVSVRSATVADRERERASSARDDFAEIAGFQRRLLTEIDLASTGQRAIQRLRDTVEEASGSVGLGRLDLLLRDVHPTDLAREMIEAAIVDRAVDEADTVYRDRPIVRSELMSSISAVYLALGRVEEAASTARIAFETAEASRGPDHLRTLWFMVDLALAEQARGNNDAAELLYIECLRRREQAGQSRHLHMHTTQANYAVALYHTGRLDDAERQIRAALGGFADIEARGDHVQSPYDNLSVVARRTAAQQILAAILQRTGRPGEALSFIEKGFNDYVNSEGEQGPAAQYFLHRMSSIQTDLGRHTEAIESARRAWERADSMHGTQHNLTDRAAYQLVSAIVKAGESGDRSDGLAAEGERLAIELLERPGPQPLLHDLRLLAARATAQQGRFEDAVERLSTFHGELQLAQPASDEARRYAAALAKIYEEWIASGTCTGCQDLAERWRQLAEP